MGRCRASRTFPSWQLIHPLELEELYMRLSSGRAESRHMKHIRKELQGPHYQVIFGDRGFDQETPTHVTGATFTKQEALASILSCQGEQEEDVHIMLEHQHGPWRPGVFFNARLESMKALLLGDVSGDNHPPAILFTGFVLDPDLAMDEHIRLIAFEAEDEGTDYFTTFVWQFFRPMTSE